MSCQDEFLHILKPYRTRDLERQLQVAKDSGGGKNGWILAVVILVVFIIILLSM